MGWAAATQRTRSARQEEDNSSSRADDFFIMYDEIIVTHGTVSSLPVVRSVADCLRLATTPRPGGTRLEFTLPRWERGATENQLPPTLRRTGPPSPREALGVLSRFPRS